MPSPRLSILEANEQFDPYGANDESKELAKKLSTAINVMGESALRDVALLMIRDHRTLQQGLMREFIWPMLQLWAEDYSAKRFDDRNEDTVRLAFRIVETFKDSAYFRFI